MNRRGFIKATGGLAIGSALSGWPTAFANSEEKDQDFFVLLRGLGGWDVTLGLDPWLKDEKPKDTDLFIEYRKDELIELSGGRFLGPSAAPMQKHGDDISIVNGVFQSPVDNGHPASTIYMSTGRGDGSIAAMPLEVAHFGQKAPFGVLYGSNLIMGNRFSITSSTREIASLPGRFDPALVLQRIFAGAKHSSSYAQAVKSLVESRVITRDLLERVDELSKKFQVIPDEQIAVAALLTGASRHVQITRNDDFDTHANHVGRHIQNQRNFWQYVSDVFDLFKSTEYKNGESLFDRTTFVVISEFARTPALNSTKGKDHNPMTNSVMLGGRGFRKGQVVGASKLITAEESRVGRSYHIGSAIDYQTGEVELDRTPQSEMIFPENVVKTVQRFMLPNEETYTALPRNVKLLESLLL